MQLSIVKEIVFVMIKIPKLGMENVNVLIIQKMLFLMKKQGFVHVKIMIEYLKIQFVNVNLKKEQFHIFLKQKELVIVYINHYIILKNFIDYKI